MTGAKNMRKRLTLKEKVALIEDSMQPGFKQSKAAMKWKIRTWKLGYLNSLQIVKILDLVNFLPLIKKFTKSRFACTI